MFSSPGRHRRVWPYVLVALVAVVVGLWFGGHPGDLPSPLRSVFVSESTIAQREQTVLDLISHEYYRPVDTERLLNAGLEAAVASLHDPYSHYFPPAGYRTFQDETTNPQVSGIGVSVVQVPVGLRIVEVIPESPAARSGLRTGELITAVGSTQLRGHSSSFSSDLIRGRVGTPVTLTVRQGKSSRRVRIVRAEIAAPVAASQLLHYRGLKLGYLSFVAFAQGSADELRQQVQRMLHEHAQGLILDLRDNGGGLLEQAIHVASLFISRGPIVTTRGRAQPTVTYTALGGAIAARIPMVVLVNRDTASSAEIVTGALKDDGRAKIVGTNTYGKGVFQEIQNLPWGGALDITVGEYYTPNGRNLGGGGVKEGRGIAPNVYAPDNPEHPGLQALRTGERVLAAEIR